jgi:hypothetical protein
MIKQIEEMTFLNFYEFAIKIKNFSISFSVQSQLTIYCKKFVKINPQWQEQSL